MGVVYKAFDSELERSVAEGRGNDGLFQFFHAHRYYLF